MDKSADFINVVNHLTTEYSVGSSPMLGTFMYKTNLRVCPVVFLGVLPFSTNLTSRMSFNNLEWDVQLNKHDFLL